MRTGGLLQRVLLVLLLTTGLITMHGLADRMAASSPMAGMSVLAATVAPDEHPTANGGTPAPVWARAMDNRPLTGAAQMGECLAVLLVLALLAVAVTREPGRVRPETFSTARRIPAPAPSRAPCSTPVLRI